MRTDDNKFVLETLEREIELNTAPLSKVIDYSPPKFIPNWDYQYQDIATGKSYEKRPLKNETKLDVRVKQGNSIGFSKNLEGCYFLATKDHHWYLGLTNKNVEQRFHAHLTKITATFNNQHNHTKGWVNYAKERYRLLQEKSVEIDDISMSFMNVNVFSKYLTSADDDPERLEEFECLTFYYFKKKYPDWGCLNNEASVGKKKFRPRYKKLWNIV